MGRIASREPEINYDTLSDLPQPVTFPFVNQILLSKLRECPGWTVKGSVAPEYGAGTYWGQGIKLETGEVFTAPSQGGHWGHRSRIFARSVLLCHASRNDYRNGEGFAVRGRRTGSCK